MTQAGKQGPARTLVTTPAQLIQLQWDQ